MITTCLEGAIVYGDRADNLYYWADILAEANIFLTPIRKRNSKRPLASWVHHWQHVDRNMVETTASLVERMLPKHIHAVTAAGFELKVALFLLSLSFDRAFR